MEESWNPFGPSSKVSDTKHPPKLPPKKKVISETPISNNESPTFVPTSSQVQSFVNSNPHAENAYDATLNPFEQQDFPEPSAPLLRFSDMLAFSRDYNPFTNPTPSAPNLSRSFSSQSISHPIQHNPPPLPPKPLSLSMVQGFESLEKQKLLAVIDSLAGS